MLCLGLFLFSFYCAGLINPELWWGTHFIAFLPAGFKYLILVASGLLIVGTKFRIWKIRDTQLLRITQWIGRFPKLFIILMGVSMCFLFYHLPIFDDIYGDSFLLRDQLDLRVTSLQPEIIKNLYSFDLQPSQGRKFILAIVNLLSFKTGATCGQVFVWIGLVCGFTWVVLWLSFVKNFLTDPIWKTVMAIVGLTAPCIQIFFGHNEVYAPTYCLMLFWFLLLFKFIANQRGVFLIILLILWLLLLKMHPLSIFLLPVWLLAFLSRFKHRFHVLSKLLTFRGMLFGVVIPAFVAGIIAYFFILQDHKDLRILELTSETERLFLPIISPPAPYDRYNLLSFNHIIDFLNIVLFWSSSALFLIGVVFVFFRKQISWNKLPILLTGLPLLFYAAFLFMFNPILTMPMDWDLYSLVVPILLAFTLALVSQLQHRKAFARKALLCCLAFGLLQTPFIYVNAHKNPYSERLINVGVHVYKTYYEWSGWHIRVAFELIQDDPELILKKRKWVLEQFKPHVIHNNDKHYAEHLSEYGAHFLQINRPDTARKIFIEAYNHNSANKVNLLRLLETNFRLKHFDQAYENSLNLIKVKYPDARKALRMSIHCALEAKKFDDALKQASTYIERWPSDSTIMEAMKHLETGRDLENVRLLFARPD
jgi:hypothetical protein